MKVGLFFDCGQPLLEISVHSFLRSSKYMRKRRILIGLSLLKPISTIGDKNNLSRGGREETRTGTFFTGGTGVKGNEKHKKW